MPSTKCPKSLQYLAVKEVVKILFDVAERGQDRVLQDVLQVLQHLGLFSDIFMQSMHFLQQKYDDTLTPQPQPLAATIQYRGPKKKKMEKLDSAVKILLPTLLNSRLTVLNLKCNFVQCSFQAKEIILSSIRHLPFLEKVDVTGFCTDELALQLGLYSHNLRHLSASNSKQLTDLALSALTGVLRVNKTFVTGCKKLKRLDIFNCPQISTSKIVSTLLTLPELTFLSSEKLPQVFESSALFESGQQFQLANFEHVVTHLERAREKINHHLRSEDQVREIFPHISIVKLTLSHLYDDTSTLTQLSHFDHIHTLVLEQPVGKLDQNFRQFLAEKGHRLRKLCLRAHSARLADLAAVLEFCNRLRVFQFYSMILESSLEYFSFHSREDDRWKLPEMMELCLGCTKLTISPHDGMGPQIIGLDIFSVYFKDVVLRTSKLRTLVLSGSCSSWINDKGLQDIIESGSFEKLKKLSITGKATLSPNLTRNLLRRCHELQTVNVKGYNCLRRNSNG